MWWPAVDKYTTATTATVNYNTIVQFCFIDFLTWSISFSSSSEVCNNSMEQPIGCSCKNETANNNNDKIERSNSSTREHLVYGNLIRSEHRKIPGDNQIRETCIKKF